MVRTVALVSLSSGLLGEKFVAHEVSLGVSRLEAYGLKVKIMPNAMRGILCGKPMDELYADEYEAILREVVGDPDLPIVTNLNVGHATPRCVIPLGFEAEVDAAAQVIRFG